MFDRSKDCVPALSSWLQKYQPCLFGRLAAKLGLIHYCILREDDLSSDEQVSDKIQEARRKWTKAAYDGKVSAFVVLLISPKIAQATPDQTVFKIARRLCSAYLPELDVKPDTIHHERIWLEKPGPERTTWMWAAGVNYFCSQGDQRWWNDHRIPGGMAFSVNSVGHLAKSGRVSQVMNELNEELGLETDEFVRGTVRSLDDALVYAMLTIDNASNAISGKATGLLPLTTDEESPALPTCPVNLPGKISGKDHCKYSGWYHTDFTLPSEYFRSDIHRPNDAKQHKLDFTYLFLDDPENPDFVTMGRGRQIRAGRGDQLAETLIAKRSRMKPDEVAIDDCVRLKLALGLQP